MSSSSSLLKSDSDNLKEEETEESKEYDKEQVINKKEKLCGPMVPLLPILHWFQFRH